MASYSTLIRLPSLLRFALIWVIALQSLDVIAQEMTKADVKQSVKSIASVVDRHYFDIAMANQIREELESELANGAYENVASIKTLADRVTATMFKLTRDKHLVVWPQKRRSTNSGKPVSKITEAEASAQREAQRAIDGKRENFGIQKFELLPGNIAYLSFSSFYRDYEIREILAAQMKLAANADAVILDMRTNMGGSTTAVALLASYFFEGPKRKLFDVVPRNGKTTSYFTDPSIQNRNGSRPVYVLVQPSTFSGGEGLAFILQDQKRAKVIGERTAGAANPGRPYAANSLFEVNVPNGQIKAAIGGGNWEGKGVKPDIDSMGEDALNVAQRTALTELIGSAEDKSYKTKLGSLLRQLLPE